MWSPSPEALGVLRGDPSPEALGGAGVLAGLESS